MDSDILIVDRARKDVELLCKDDFLEKLTDERINQR